MNFRSIHYYETKRYFVRSSIYGNLRTNFTTEDRDTAPLSNIVSSFDQRVVKISSIPGYRSFQHFQGNSMRRLKLLSSSTIIKRVQSECYKFALNALLAKRKHRRNIRRISSPSLAHDSVPRLIFDQMQSPSLTEEDEGEREKEAGEKLRAFQIEIRKTHFINK